MTKLNEFKCSKCGGHNLAYQKYIRCIEPVAIKDDGHIEYAPAVIEQDDYLSVECGFICRDCGHYVAHCGYRFETERELIAYLYMNPQKKEAEERNYEALIDAEAREQEAEEISAN